MERGPMSRWRALHTVVCLTAVVVGSVGVQQVTTDPIAELTVSSRAQHEHVEISTEDPVRSFHVLAAAPLTPGDTTAGLVTVTNTGDAPLGYYIDAAASNDDGKGLGRAFVVRVTSATAPTVDGRDTRCGGEPLPNVGDRFAGHLVGTPRRTRSLDAGDAETLCVQAHLPGVLPPVMQGAASQVTFTVIGTS